MDVANPAGVPPAVDGSRDERPSPGFAVPSTAGAPRPGPHDPTATRLEQPPRPQQIVTSPGVQHRPPPNDGAVVAVLRRVPVDQSGVTSDLTGAPLDPGPDLPFPSIAPRS